MEHRLQQVRENRAVVLGAVAAAAGLAGALWLYRSRRRPVRRGAYPPSSLPDGAYDAVIVGGGPSGRCTSC